MKRKHLFTCLVICLLPVFGCAENQGDQASISIQQTTAKVQPKDPEAVVREIFTKVVRTLQSTKAESKTYTEALVGFRKADEGIQRILSDHPASPIAIQLWSGTPIIRGLSLSQVQEIKTRLEVMAQAEESPFHVALVIAMSFEDAYDRADMLFDIAKTLIEANRKEEGEMILTKARIEAEKADASWHLIPIATAFASARNADEAFRTAESISGASERFFAFRAIAGAFLETGQQTAATTAFQKATFATSGIENPSEKFRMLTSIAKSRAKAGQTVNAVEIIEILMAARSIKTQAMTVKTLVELAVALLDAGQIVEPNDILINLYATGTGIKDPARRSDFFQSIGVSLAAGKQTDAASTAFDRAVVSAQDIASDWQKISRLLGIAEELAKAGFSERLDQVFSLSRSVAENTTPNSERVMYLSWIAASLALAGRAEEAGKLFDEALTAAKSTPQAQEVSRATATISVALAGANQFDEAMRVAVSIDDADERTLAISKIENAKSRAIYQRAIALRDAHDFADALRTAEKIKEESERVRVLGSIALKLAEIHRWENALTTAESIPDNHVKKRVKRRIAEELADAGKFKEAINLITGLDDGKTRCEIVGKIAVATAHDDNFSQSIDLAESIRDSEVRIITLVLISTLAPSNDAAVAHRILHTIKPIENFWD